MRNTISYRAAAVAVLLLAGATTAAAQSGLVGETTGRYRVVMEEISTLPDHTVYRPSNLSEVRGAMPVVVFGNGACQHAGNAFENYLSEISSHGFVVVANGTISAAALPAGRPPRPGTPPSGRGRGAGPAPRQSTTSQLFETLDWAKQQNGDSKSPFYRKLDLDKLAVAGQSCGGLQALEAAGDPRFRTAVIFNSGVIRGALPGRGDAAAAPAPARVLPATVESLKKIHTPIIYIIGGESDIAYKNAEADFADLPNVPAFKVNMDTGHNGTLWEPHGGRFAEIATQWLRWQLMGDEKAGALFVGPTCGLCQVADLKVERKNMR